MKSRHVVLWLKAIMTITALMAGIVNVRYQDWIIGEARLRASDERAANKSGSHTPSNPSYRKKKSSPMLRIPIASANNAGNSVKTNSITTTNSTILLDREFQHHDGVAIVTKIHGPHQWGLLQQSMCLLHFAYNRRVLYDIVVFTAESIPSEMVESLKSLVAPSKVTIALDNRGLKEEIEALPASRYRTFLDRCKNHIHNTTTVSNKLQLLDDQAIIQNLTWFSDCGDGRLAYNWQAEFRSLHIWHHPALAKYKWMMWMDTDGFCTKPWERDPVAIAIYHDLAIFFDNYHGGGSRKLASAIAKGFGVSLCQTRMTGKGQLESTLGSVEDAMNNEFCNNSRVEAIHGFFHVTNLDFYRNPGVSSGTRALFGDCFLCRFPDDQLSVTIPAAILAPNRSWDMRRNEVKLDVFHNFRLDGRDEEKTMGFKQLWKLKRLRQSMKEARAICPVTEKA